jgi:hypothetical protein
MKSAAISIASVYDAIVCSGRYAGAPRCPITICRFGLEPLTSRDAAVNDLFTVFAAGSSHG